MKKYFAACLAIGVLSFPAFAQEVEEPFICCENYDPAVDSPVNLAALTTGDQVSNIEGESGGAVGAKDGEITLQFSSSGASIFSGLNKVETIARGSDGWTGSILEEESDHVVYQPAGRPALTCESQPGMSGWFGPCKVPEQEEGA